MGETKEKPLITMKFMKEREKKSLATTKVPNDGAPMMVGPGKRVTVAASHPDKF